MEMNTRDIILNRDNSRAFLNQIHNPSKKGIEIRDEVFKNIDERITSRVENGVIYAEIPDMDISDLDRILGDKEETFKSSSSSSVCELSNMETVIMITNSFGKCA